MTGPNDGLGRRSLAECPYAGRPGAGTISLVSVTTRSKGPGVHPRTALGRRAVRHRHPARAPADPGPACGDHGVGPGRGVSDTDCRFGLQPRTAAALHRHRADRGKHRPPTPGTRRGSGLAAVCACPVAVRPQPGRGGPGGRTDAVAVPARGGALAVLRHRADGVVARTPQDAETALVGSRHQRGLHVVLRPAVRGRRCAMAAQP